MYTSRGETCITECWPEHGHVTKQFKPRKPKFGRAIDPLRESLDLCFYRELTCLQRLAGKKHFPQVLDYNEDELWIKMTWVGRPFLHFADEQRDPYLAQVDPIVDALSESGIRLAYRWTPYDPRLGYCLSMMMVRSHQLGIIDFERAWPMGCGRESEFNDLFRDSFDGHSNTEFRRTLADTIINTMKQPPPKGIYEKE